MCNKWEIKEREEIMKEQKFKHGVFLFISLVVFVLFIIAFVNIVDELQEDEIKHFDDAVFIFIQSLISDRLTAIMKVITYLGGVQWIVLFTLLVIILLLVYKKYSLALFLALTTSVGGGFNWVLKWLFKRERPDMEALIEQSGYSFPSGHSMGSFILYGSIAFILFRAFDYRYLKWISAFTGGLLVLFIGLSRVYLHVHYASDIIGGFTAGGAWLTFCIAFYIHFYNKRRWKKHS